MRFFPRLRSLKVVVLLGFAVVALPLISAVVLTTTFVNSLAENSERVVEQSVKATSGTRLLLEHIASLERNARQYLVIGDAELLDIVRTRVTRLSEILDELRRLNLRPDEPLSEPDNVEAIATDILKALQAGEQAGALRARFEKLSAAGARLSGKLSDGIDAELQALKHRARSVQTFLFWEAMSVILLTLLLAGLFAALITRPIRELGQAIRQLGEGEMMRAITVRGPLDLEELGRRLDWLRRRLNELEREKNDFLSHVSHELKTPLTNIREGTELLADGSVGAPTAEQREVIEILQTNSRNLQHKIENLLNFNIWRNMKNGLQRGECRLREVFDHALEQHRLALNRVGLHTDVRIPDVRINADYDKLRLMFDNLISNAVKFSPPGGTLYVRARRVPGAVHIDVADEGPGIPAEDRDRVFEPFYGGRLVQRGPVRGTGIGLAVVLECVRSHGGSIEIREGEYSGAHFRIELPV